jgi:hypothetical protein
MVILAAALGSAQTPPRPKAPEVVLPGSSTPKAPKQSGVQVARLVILGAGVEKAAEGGVFKSVGDGERLHTGERLRTGPGALARMQLPWMALTLGAESVLFIPPSTILSAVLEAGRAELSAEGDDLLKLRTPEAEVRGRGRLVVRRTGTTTLVMAMAGAFRVETKALVLSVAQGQGVVAPAAGSPDGPNNLPDPPTEVYPGEDPVFVKRGAVVALRFTSPYKRHHVQVVAFDGAEIVVDRDVGLSPQTLRVPWLGTWRVRVSSVDDRGLEGPPAVTGYLVVVDE